MIYGNATDFYGNAMAMLQKFIASKVKESKVKIYILSYYTTTNSNVILNIHSMAYKSHNFKI